MKHEGVRILEETLSNNILNKLKTLVGVSENDIQILDNGFRFQFEGCPRANQCSVIGYKDKVIFEFRNIGESDKLVYEDIHDPREFENVFEKVTQVYFTFE